MSLESQLHQISRYPALLLYLSTPVKNTSHISKPTKADHQKAFEDSPFQVSSNYEFWATTQYNRMIEEQARNDSTDFILQHCLIQSPPDNEFEKSLPNFIRWA